MQGKGKRLWLATCAAIAVAGIGAPLANATGSLSASKTAEAHWTRTFNWTIDKSVTPASWDLEKGKSGQSTYTVAVTKSAGTDTVSVSGQVCVENVSAEPTENLKIVDRLQALVGADVVTIVSEELDLSVNPVLDPGESQCYPYSLPFEAVAGADSYRNNARVTITNDPRDPGEETGPNEKADFSMPASPTLVNDVVNVDDTNGMSWQFSATGSKTYKRTFTCDDKGTYRNTATIRETGQSDSATVTVTCKKPPKDECKKDGHDWKKHWSNNRCDDDDDCDRDRGHKSWGNDGCDHDDDWDRCKGDRDRHDWSGLVNWFQRLFH